MVLEWLDKYDITDREVYNYKLGWSESEQRLYFPIYDADGNLLFCQGRYYGHDKHKPRYLSRGKGKEFLCFLQTFPQSGTIIACEDYISAIKIARIENSWCLFGSNLSTEALNRVSRSFRRLGIWLDRDKADYALKSRLRASLYFEDCVTIVTEKDPKCYSTEEIGEYLNEKRT